MLSQTTRSFSCRKHAEETLIRDLTTKEAFIRDLTLDKRRQKMTIGMSVTFYDAIVDGLFIPPITVPLIQFIFQRSLIPETVFSLFHTSTFKNAIWISVSLCMGVPLA